MGRSLDRAKAAKAAGGDANSVEANSGRTALHKACFWGHDNIAAWLVNDCGANVNAVDYNGDTALHDAARFGHAKVLRSPQFSSPLRPPAPATSHAL